ncbi:MAG: methyl-accepting chemotaxis protein, partial [Spirochaetaceae bacterium]
MKNIKLGVKMIGGFIAVALIVAVVGFFGWQGAVQMNDHVSEIGEVRLPSIESLLIIKTESNAIRISLRSLLNPRMTMEERERQYANIARSRENWQAAWAAYEPLPQTPEEAALWREFVPAWNAWAEVNNEFIEYSREVERTDVLNPDAYEAMIAGFIVDHHELMSNVTNYLLTGASFTGGDDPTACNFGQWMRQYRTTNPQIERLLQEVHAHHNPFHQSVGRIQNFMQAGNTQAAVQEYTQVMRPAAEETFAIFDQLLDEADRIVGVLETAHVHAMGVAVQRQTAAVDLLDQIILINEQVAREAVAEANADGAQVQFIALVGIILGVVLALALGITLTRGITKPVSAGVVFARRLAGGDMTGTLDVNQKDEIGVLAEALREMAENLKRTVISVRGASDNVAAGSQQMSSTAQQMSQGATEQAAAAEEVSSSMEEMGSNIRQNADNAAQTESIAK